MGRTEANSSYSTSLSIRCTKVSKGKFRENIPYSHWNHLDTLTGRKFAHRVFRKKNVLQSAKHDISHVIYLTHILQDCGPGSSVGIATDYGWTVWDRIPVRARFSTHPHRPWGHPASCKMGTGSFMGVKCGHGVLLTTHPLLVSQS